MRVPRIYTHQVLSPQTQLELESAPAQHIARAMRMRAGDALTLFNGRGGEYAATIGSVGKKTVLVTVGEHHDTEKESPLAIHLGIAVSRGERMDWLIQKAVELGVCSISPLFTQRTEVKLKGDRADKKVRHWQLIAIAACEQCGRNQLPAINPPQNLSAWVETTQADRKLVLHHRATIEAEAQQAPASIALLIGPEGGLSPLEISTTESVGYGALRLGPRIMRTETAPLAAIAILQARWGDMPLG